MKFQLKCGVLLEILSRNFIVPHWPKISLFHIGHSQKVSSLYKALSLIESD